ncbi:MAG: hypothetical protein R3F62_23050 [Planctomycetota bacterium]
MLRGVLGLLLVATALSVQAKDRLRVATVDVAGLAQGDQRLERLRAFAERLGKAADVVVLEGLFDDGDARALNELLELHGLVHTQRYDRGWGGSGLLIASRYPLSDQGFTGFSWAGKPHKPWHGDYYTTQGVGLVSVDSPLGTLWVAATSWHPRYGSVEYRWLRIHQALETADAVGDHGQRPPEEARDPGRHPLVLCGALGCEPRAVPLKVLCQAAGLTQVRETLGPGWIATRPGGTWGLEPKQVQALFDAPVPVEGGGSQALVDTPGWLVEFGVRRYPNGPRLARAEVFRATADELLPLVRDEVEYAEREGRRATLLGVGLFLVGGALYAVGWILGRPPTRAPRKRKRRPSGEGEVGSDSGSGRVDSGERTAPPRRRRRGCCLFGCLSLLVAHGALWLIYQGRVFVPYETKGLRSTVSLLEPPEVIVLDGPR